MSVPSNTAIAPDIAAWLAALGFGPVVTSTTANQNWTVGQVVSLKLAANTFTDDLGLPMTYRATLASGAALPAWLSFNAGTETFSGTVPVGTGPLSLTVYATDAWGITRGEQFAVGIVATATVAHSAPKLTAQTANQIWVAGVAETLTLASNTFTDPQGAALSYAATLANGAALPSWLKFNAATRSFSGTEPAGAAPVTVKLTATDSYGLATSETFVISLAAAPVVTAATGAQYWVAGKAQTLSLAGNTFTDPQGAALSYSATLASGGALPSWLKFNAVTDSFSGTDPTGTAPLTIKVTATDSYGLSTSESFTLSLASAPVVASQTAAQSWTQGRAVSFTLPAGTFKDPQGASLSYSATLSTGAALPSWLKFNATTGAFTGTEPTGTSAFSIKVTATDSYGLATSETFAVATPAATTPPPAAPSGLVINVTYDSSVSSAPSGFTAAINAAVAYLEKEFTNSMTLNLRVGYGEVGGTTIGAGALGESETNYDVVSYATLRSALLSHASQPDQLTATATLPTTSPGTANFMVANAEAKALGLVASNGTTLDGAIGISSSYAMTYDPNNRAVSGTYDAIGVMEHEITEVMGRTQSLATGNGYDSPLDLFRYSSPGVRDLVPGPGSFSINGTTLLQTYNNPLTGGDAADWASSVVGDSFGSGRAGVASLVSAVDLQEMNVLGYTRASLTS